MPIRHAVEPDGRHRRPERSGWVRSVVAIAAPAVALALVPALVLALAAPWSGSNRSELATSILNTRMIGGPAPWIAYVAAVALVVVIVLRRPARGWLIACGIGLAAGAALGYGAWLIANATDAFGVGLGVGTGVWAAAGFGAVGLSAAALVRSVNWRKSVAVISIVVALVATTFGINAQFGLDQTVADFVGTSTAKIISLPKITPTPTPTATLLDGGALWANWTPPAGMPTSGQYSQVVIPNTESGFKARPAGLYLPPAALVPNPPALPFVLMMMGQPGNPDPTYAGSILDKYAATNKGLAPIVLVVDQLGNPGVDPLCLNTARYGNAETYVVQDAVNWARTHLHILQDPAHWVVAGYSNGGECALSFAVKYPGIFHNLLDISGEITPGGDDAGGTLASVFHGDRAAYEATFPLTIIQQTNYAGMTAVFTVGSNDGIYRPQAMAAAAATQTAGWATNYYEVPDGGHVLGALNGGITQGFRLLYPVLGLSSVDANN